jgi:hypothetical protein
MADIGFWETLPETSCGEETGRKYDLEVIRAGAIHVRVTQQTTGKAICLKLTPEQAAKLGEDLIWLGAGVLVDCTAQDIAQKAMLAARKSLHRGKTGGKTSCASPKQ